LSGGSGLRKEQWGAPSLPIRIGDDEVHLWRIELNASDAAIETMVATLTEDERTRAHRFRARIHQTRFIQARGALRAILSRYVSCEPDDLQFIYGLRGKPSLGGAHAASGIRFNLSHSGGLALCAVTRLREVGVDVEVLRADKPLIRLAERFFASSEIAALRGLSQERLTAAFFQCWTLKEAYIKARGDGLSIPLNAFEVTWADDFSSATLQVPGNVSEGERWTLTPLPVDDGCAAGLAVEGGQVRVTNYEL